jgi:ectoine hydroxylase-related dioxygenase (phytanoyl-CoA dioxygenase family)
MTIEQIATEVKNQGFSQVEKVLTPAECGDLIEILPQQVKGGVRNLLTLLPITNLAQHPKILTYVHHILGIHAFPFRATLFDKNDNGNWLVPWHQDVTIPVARHLELSGWGPWSVKADILYVQPPAFILEEILTVRIHLDPCLPENGALKVLPGTQQLGRLTSEQIAEHRQNISAVICHGQAGDMVLMRPLLVHSSSKSQVNGHRRIIHFEYISQQLSDPYPKLVFA